jgi:ABC-type glycerol-3-phosphate transport system substrate-binding protein
MRKLKGGFSATAMCILLFTSACSGGGDKQSAEQGSSEQDTKPVKLLVITPSGGTPEWFMDRYGKQIQKKYPNYEFEIVESVGKQRPESRP